MILFEIYLLGMLTTFVFIFFKLMSHKRWMTFMSHKINFFGMGVVNLIAAAICSVAWVIMIWPMLTSFDSMINEACDKVEEGDQ